jgi:hypothetical protein
LALPDGDIFVYWTYHACPEDIAEPWLNIPEFSVTAESPRGDVRDTYVIGGLRARLDRQVDRALVIPLGQVKARREYLTLPEMQSSMPQRVSDSAASFLLLRRRHGR